MASKKMANRTQQVVSVLVVLGFVVVGNYLLTRTFFRIDLTEGKVYSISNATRTIIRNLDDIVNIKVVFSEKLPPSMMPIRSDVSDLLAEYQAYSDGKLNITWWDPGTTDEDRQSARGLGIQEVQMQTIERDQAQVMMGYLGIAVLFADQKEVLPMVVDQMTMKLKPNFEYDLTQAIMKVSRSETPRIGVVKTDTMPFIPPNVRRQMQIPGGDGTEEKYRPVFENLRNHYDVELVDISGGQPIDLGFKTLIVPGGTRFTRRQVYEIDQYFMGGGNLIVLADAVSVSFQYGPTGTVEKHKLLDLLAHYGARVENNMVLDAVCGSVQIPQRFGQFQMNVARPYPYFVQLVQEGFNRSIPAVATLSEVIVPWGSSITLVSDPADSLPGDDDGRIRIKGQDAWGTIVATSSPQSWTVSSGFNLDPNQQWAPPEESMRPHPMMVYLQGSFSSYFAGQNPPPVGDESDTLSQIQLSAADAGRQTLESTPAGNLIVTGDSDFLTAQNAAPGNVAWLLNTVDWLTLDNNLIAVRTRTLKDRSIRKDQLSEASAMPTVVRTINLLLMPVVLIIAGLVLFFRRREPVVVTTTPSASGAKAAEEKKNEE